MRRVRVIALLVVLILLFVGVYVVLSRGRTRESCPERADWTRVEAEYGAIIDWNAENDTGRNLPLLKGTSTSSSADARRRMDWHLWTGFNQKQINGLEYTGMLITCTYGDPDRLADEELEARLEAADADPAYHVVSIYIRRFAEPEPRIDIRLTCRITFTINFDNFHGGVLRDASTRQGSSDETFVFSPGQYHVEAVMPEGTDGE